MDPGSQVFLPIHRNYTIIDIYNACATKRIIVNHLRYKVYQPLKLHFLPKNLSEGPICLSALFPLSYCVGKFILPTAQTFLSFIVWVVVVVVDGWGNIYL